jgi:HK97 family phage major capsid protein
MPTASKFRPNKEFSLVSLIRSLSVDAKLLPGEGTYEADACSSAARDFARTPGGPLRGRILPLNRAESGGLSTSTLADGGALVSGSITLAQALQPVLQLERLGARRTQGNAGDQLVSPPASVAGWWVSEDADTPLSEALFGSAMAAPKEAAVRVRMSRSLFRQAGALAEQELRAILQRSISETVEKGIIDGSGQNSEPMGLLNDPQLQRRTYAGNGALPEASKAAELAAELAENGADVDSLQFLLSSADFADSQNLITATGQTSLIQISDGRRRLGGIPCSFSPYIPSGKLIVADFSRLVIKYVGLPQLLVDPYTMGESGTILMTLFQQVGYGVERRELLTVATVEA